MHSTTLSNSFHNTSVRTACTRDELETIIYKDPEARTFGEKILMTRLKTLLCGVKDCQCSNAIGEC